MPFTPVVIPTTGSAPSTAAKGATETEINRAIGEVDAYAASVAATAASGLAAETAARIAGDNALSASISAEASARASAITDERNARISGDAALSASIAAEASARTGAITAERNARISRDTELASSIEAESLARASAIAAEAAARNVAVTTEANARIAADNNLAARCASVERQAAADVRPGLDPQRYRRGLSVASPNFGPSDVANGPEGAELVIVGPGYVILDEKVPLGSGDIDRVFYRVRRRSSVVDPAGDGLRFGVVCYGATGEMLPGGAAFVPVAPDILDLDTAGQMAARTAIIGRSGGWDAILPPAARYYSPAIRVFGENPGLGVIDCGRQRWGTVPGATGGLANAAGPLAGRSAFDSQSAGFVYAATDSPGEWRYYIRVGAPGNWVGPNTFRGPMGEDGEDGTDAAVSFATREAARIWRITTSPPDGTVFWGAGIGYMAQSSASIIPDMPGVAPLGTVTAGHFGEPFGTHTITLSASGGDFAVPQEALGFASRFSPDEPVTISVIGEVVGNLSFWRNMPLLVISGTTRVDPTVADFTTAASPNWSGPDNNSTNPGTNTLFGATRASVRTMLLTKYASRIRVVSGNGISLNGMVGGRIENILLYSQDSAQRGVSTGGNVVTGSGGQIELRNCSIHGFMSSGVSCDYGGVINLLGATGSDYCTISCCGQSGVNLQYAGGTVYAQSCIIFGNFLWGGRIAQFGALYQVSGYIGYNRLDGLSSFGGGQFNAAGATIENNGASGVSLWGTGSFAELSGSVIRNNLGQGIRVSYGASAAAREVEVTGCGSAGLYVVNGGNIWAPSCVSSGNNGGAAWVFADGYINVQSAELSNSANGPGARVDLNGFIDAQGARIFGNVNFFAKQVLCGRGGRINVTGATHVGSAPISDDETTPPRNQMTVQGAFILDNVSPSAVRVLTQQFIRTTIANGPGLQDEAASATNPTVIPDATASEDGMGRSASTGEITLIDGGVLAFAAHESYVRVPTEIRVGAGAGQRVVGARQPAIANPSGGSTVDTQARSAITSILAALRAHGLIAT